MKKILKIIGIILFLLIVNKNFGQTTNYDSIKAIIESSYDFTTIDSSNENSPAKSALEWLDFYEKRLDENGNTDGYVQNLNEYLMSNKSGNGINKHWEYIGHTNQLNSQYPSHNQITRIWVDPNDYQHIIAGTLLNGAWETYDEGDNWNCITDNEPKIRGISSIEVITQGNTTTIYLGSNASSNYTPAYSIGLFYTTDDGATWNEQEVNVGGIALFPKANCHFTINQWLHYSDNIQFLLLNNYFYRSNDGGASFEEIFYKNPQDYQNGIYSAWEGGNTLRKMLVNPNNPNELFISGPELLKYNISTGNIDNLTDNLKNGIVDEIFMTDIAKSKINTNIFWFMGCKRKFVNNKAKFDISMVKYDDNTGQYIYYGPYEDEDAMYFRMFETSPFDDETISLGNTYNDYYNVNNGFMKLYKIIHHDIRASVLLNENNHLVQIQGTDGGIGKVTYPGTIPESGPNVLVENITNDGSNGILNYNLLGFDVSTNTDDDMMLLACSDNSTIFEKNGTWQRIFGQSGDGYSCQFSKSDPSISYSTEADYNELYYFNTTSINTKSIFSYDNASKVPGFKRSFVIDPDNSRVLFTGQVNQLIKLLVNEDFSNTTVNTLDITPYFPPQVESYSMIPQFFTKRSNSNFFYVCTNGYQTSMGLYGPMLLKVSTDLTQTTDLTNSVIEALNTQQNKTWMSVTSIALDPYNLNRFWISVSGISECAKVYVTNNDGATFEPMGDGLPDNFPVNEVTFDERTNVLYAVNDVGIYFFDEKMAVWNEITGDLPPVFCNFVRFSPDHKNIRLGSKGRGPWETSSCIYTGVADTIYSNQTWNKPKFATNDIIIETGVTLTVNNTIYMPSDAKIIVERGAQLIIDGGTLTNACDDLWQGVEVWGTSTQPQQLPYQGLVKVINGGTIENAVCAVRAVKMDVPSEGVETPDLAYTGGIVWANNGKFYNNKTAVRFYSYHDNSTSYFTDCVFQLQGELPGGELPDYFVKMSRTKGIIFTHCDFNRDDLANQFVGSGIYAYDSKFRVIGNCLSGDNPCSQWQLGSFRYLKYGIYAVNSSLGTNYPVIDHQYFSLCRSGIYLGTIEGAEVTSNSFLLSHAPVFNDDRYYGLYMDNSTKYHVEDNTFERAEDDLGYIGLYVNNSGDDWNQIYNNSFSYLYYGIVAYGDNRKSYEKGLCIKCNDFDHIKNDIIVNGANPKTDGIAYNQGYQGANDTLPAGNTFTKDENTIKFNFYNSDDCGFVNYVYHGINWTNKKVNPQPYYSDETISKQENSSTTYNKEIACPSKLGGGGSGGGTGSDRQAITEAESHINQDNAQLDAIVDGGNTPAVAFEVMASTPQQGGEVYQDLMNKSPYLSDTVMKSAISKEYVLPNAMVRDILVANPHSAKEKDVLAAIDDRFEPMPQWMRDQILQGVSVTSVKENIERDIARWTEAREEHLNNLYLWYKNNSDDNPVYYDSLVELLENENDLQYEYRLAFVYLNNGDTVSAVDLLSSLDGRYEMTNAESAEYQEYQTLFGILAQLDASGIPDSAQAVQLQQLAQNDKLYPGAYARSMLIEAGLLDYVEPVIIPDELKSSAAIESETGIEKPYSQLPLKVFPNPAKDYIIVDYDTQGKTGTVVLTVSDMKGGIVTKQAFNLNRDQRVISTKDWDSGVYIVNLSVNGSTLKAVKVTVN